MLLKYIDRKYIYFFIYHKNILITEAIIHVLPVGLGHVRNDIQTHKWNIYENFFEIKWRNKSS